MAEPAAITNVSAQQQIEEVVRRVVERFHPEKLILFGSRARGNASPDSDADLLVVMPVSGSIRKQATEIERALVGVKLPLDVIVATPEQLERQKDQKGTIFFTAVRQGRVLYERAA